MPSNFKTPIIKDKEHVVFIKTLPCLVTGSDIGNDPHHLMRDDMRRIIRGGGMTSGDNFVIPLCRLVHNELHADGNETRYLELKGIWNPVELALILFAHTGDELFCNRVIEAWRK